MCVVNSRESLQVIDSIVSDTSRADELAQRSSEKWTNTIYKK